MGSVPGVGVLSGTFDPIHDGHLELAREAIKQLGLQQVWFVVEAEPRHKQAVAAYKDRIAMVSLAIEGNPQLRLQTVQTSQHSLATMEELLAEHLDTNFVLLMGADTAQRVQQWDQATALQERFPIAVATRDGHGHDPAHIHIKNHLSSRAIRNQLTRGEKPDGLRPAVLSYIKEYGLYGG